MTNETRQAMKLVKKRYPFSVSIKVAPFYGWAIVVAKGSDRAIVMKQRTEESAWLAAADAVKG